MSMMKMNKYFELLTAYNKITKLELNNRIKRVVKRNIRQTEYFDLIKNGSYVNVLSVVTEKKASTIVAYLSEYDKEGIYKHKFPMIHLAKIAKFFDSSLEYLLGIVDVLSFTNTANEYIELNETYNNTDKLVIAANIRIFKKNEVNGICTNMDIGNLLGISDNAVKANLSTGKSALSNRFSIEHLYKIANAYDIEIDRLFEESKE